MKKLLFLLLLLFIVLPSHAAIKVSPTIIELDANKARGNYLTTSFDIQGSQDETIRFKVYPGYFNISKTGGMEIVDDDNTAAKDSLINNIRFVPNEFTLTNGQKQRVRVTFNDISKLQDGESRVVLFLEDVVAKEVSLPMEQGSSSKLVVKSRIGIPIYIDKGKYIKLGQFDDLKVENSENNLVYKMCLSSQGNSKVRYTGKGQIIKDKDLVDEFNVPGNPINAGGVFDDKFKIPTEKLRENEQYTLRLVLEYQNEKNQMKQMVKEVQFIVPNLPEENSASMPKM